MFKRILLGVAVLSLAGCATSADYSAYTARHFVPKDPLSTVNVYSESQPLAAVGSYYVIGKVSIEGFASNGVGFEMLISKAKRIAQKRGADAIINAKREILRYYGGDSLLRFRGELIVFVSSVK